MRKPYPEIARRLAAIAAALHISLFAGPAGAFGSGGNALDRIDFGSDASETVHQLKENPDKAPLAGVGALRETYRAPNPRAGESPGTDNDHLTFTMKVDPARQNYLTVKLWGGDQQTAGLFLQGCPRNYGAMDWNGTGGPPPFPNRFYYTTIPIPLADTKGRNSAELVLYEGNAPANRPGRPIYSAFSHVEPMFVPEPSNATGEPLPLTGQRMPETLSEDRVADLLRRNRQSIYGGGGYYESMLSRQIMPGTKVAPPEVMGLDLWTPVAGWGNDSRTADEWRDQAGGHGHGGGYATVPDELLSVLTSTYLLPPLLDAHNAQVAGLDHYHEPDILRRVILALDACTYVQSSDGSFNDHGWDGVHNVLAEGHWQGLCSTPRAEGRPYAGTRKRGSGWSLTLEGANTSTLGWTMLQLLNDPTAAPIFKKALGQSFDANLDGKPIERAIAYERMMNNQIAYQARIFGGGTVSQAMMATNSIYTNLVALYALERLFPYPDKNSSFPGDTVSAAVEVPYPALAPAQGVAFVKQAVGVDPVTKIMGNLYRAEFQNYTISKAGLGEAGGTASGGYDGRYGRILPWMASRMAQIATWDPAIEAASLRAIRAKAGAATDAYTHFISPQEQFHGVTNEFTLAQEDFITYRDPYNANANGNDFAVGSRYVVSDPRSGMSTALSMRACYLEALYGMGPNDLQYLKDLAAYEGTMRALMDVAPDRMTALQGEPGQPNMAWADVQTGATAAYFNGERFYMNANWRNVDINGDRGHVSNLARIHDTTRAVDRTALVFMPHDDATEQVDGNISGKLYEPWVVRYGAWLVMGNPSAESAELRLPKGSGVALDLISNKRLSLGGGMLLAPGQAAVIVLPVDFTQAIVPDPRPPVPDGVYTLTAAHSGLALDKSLHQQSPDQSASQNWIVSWNNGYYTFRNAASNAWLSGSGNLSLEKSAADNDRLWKLLANGIGYELINKGTGGAIDVLYGSADAGQSVTLHPYNGGLNQTWSFQASTGVFQ
jgi:hypothetical protein